MAPGFPFDLYIIDMGNVVVRNIETIEKISELYGLDFNELQEDYGHYVHPLMEGAIDASVYWRHVERLFDIQVAGDPFVECFDPCWNEPVRDFLEQLGSAGIRVVVGSNTYVGHWERLRKMGFLELFDAEYPSHAVGISKPSRRFFEHILAAERVQPHQACFIDDTPCHVESARSLGIQSILYTLDAHEPNIMDAIFT